MIPKRRQWILAVVFLLPMAPTLAQSAGQPTDHAREQEWIKRLERLEETVRLLEQGRGLSAELAAEKIDQKTESREHRLARLEARVALLMQQNFSPSQDSNPLTPASSGPSPPGSQTPAPVPVLQTPVSQPVTQVKSADAGGEAPEHIPVAGYMEMHFNKREGSPSRLDFHRFVLLFSHSFSSRVRLWSELELEHALVEGREEKGELELEQAYLDFYLSPYLNLRGGMLLAPVGILNERHEPPSFFGVERPQVDTVIIPSTWFDAGAGIWGDLGGGLSYRAYVMAPLNASEFSAAEGLRGGRQKGFLSDFRHAAKTFRLEYRGIPKLVLGASYWTGKSGFEAPGLKVPVRVFDFDGRFRYRNFDARGQYSHNWIGEAAALNRALVRRRGNNPNIAEQMRGFYLEGGVHLLPRDARRDLAAFLRYENYDTQYRMPQGFLPLKQFDRSNWTVGLNYYPHPDVVVKFDYLFNRNESRVVKARNQFNVGLGWWF